MNTPVSSRSLPVQDMEVSGEEDDDSPDIQASAAQGVVALLVPFAFAYTRAMQNCWSRVMLE